MISTDFIGFNCQKVCGKFSQMNQPWCRCTRQNMPPTKIILAKAICNGHRLIHVYI